MSNKILNVNIKVTLRPGWRNQCKTSGSCPCRPQALPRPARWRWRWSRQQRCWQRRRERQRRRRCRRLSAQFCTTGLGPGPHRLTTLNLGECWNRPKMSEQSFGELKLTRPSLRWSGLQRESAWHRSSCHSGSLSAPTWQRVWNVGNLRYGRFNEDILRIIWGYIEDNMRIYWG